MNSETASMGSPPPPQTYIGAQTINGVGIGTAILNHEMLQKDTLMNIADIDNTKMFKNLEKENIDHNMKYNYNNNNNGYSHNQSITDFNQSDLLHNPDVQKPNEYNKQKSNLEMLMNLHNESKGIGDHIQNDT